MATAGFPAAGRWFDVHYDLYRVSVDPGADADA